MEDTGGDPPICYRCKRGPSYHGGQSAFSTGVPAIRPRTSRSTSDRSRSSRLCSRLWKARKTHHLTLTLGESPLRPLRALLQNLSAPPPPPLPLPPPLRPSHAKDTAVALRTEPHRGSPLKVDYDEEDISDALIADPLQELFGIHTYKGENTLQDEQRKPRTPVRYFASVPAELTPPPVRSTSMSSRGTTSPPEPADAKPADEVKSANPEPEWVLPRLPRSATSGIIRGLSPIEAGAARAIPAAAPTTTPRISTDPRVTKTTYSTTMGTPPEKIDAPDDNTSENKGPRDNFGASTSPLVFGATATTGTGEAILHNRDPDYGAGLPPTAGSSPMSAQEPLDRDAQAVTIHPASKGETPTLNITSTDYTTRPSPRTMRELPEHEVRATLQPLPPGWVLGQGFTEGLHPSTDVFDQDEHEQPDEAPQQSACEKGEKVGPEIGEDSPCDNGAADLPRHSWEGIHPDATASPAGPDSDGFSSASDEQAAEGEERDEPGDLPENNEGLSAVPEPTGGPPRLTAQQRSRLHELLRTRDSDGNLPFGLDRRMSDEEMWQTYRQGMKTNYRALRKRKRAEGTWHKDDHRGWGPAQSSAGPARVRQPLPRLRERSPLPRRKHTTSS